MTINMDPDVYSVRGEFQPWMEGQEIDPEEMLDPNASDAVSVTIDDDLVDHLSKFKRPQGLVRDARMIESRLRSLYVTRDNAQTLLQEIENPNTATRFARSILATLGRQCVVLDSEDVLSTVEDKWTGNIRARASLPTPGTKIYAQFRVSYFINHTWEQIRELTYLAVSDEAREILLEYAKFRGTVTRSRFSPPECSNKEILRTIDNFLQRSVRQDFVAALTRRAYFTDMESTPVVRVNENGPARLKQSLKMIFKLDKEKKSPGVTMQNIVHGVYEKYRIGNREPSEPFLRVSARLDCEGRPLWRGWEPGVALEAPHTHLGKVLVYGDVLKGRNLPQGSEQKLCLYTLDGQTEHLQPFSIITKLLWFLHQGGIYGTVRKGKAYKTSKEAQENRSVFYFKMSEAQEHLKISRQDLMNMIFDWIKALSPPERSPAEC